MLSQLVKILGLTSSDQSGEALSAIRKANSLLKQHGLTWKDVISDNSSSRSDHDLISDLISFESNRWLDRNDKQLVAQIRERYFRNEIDDSDSRKVKYLKTKIAIIDEQNSEIPF